MTLFLQKNLETLKLVLVQVLDRFITDPALLLQDQALCDVLGASATTSRRSGRHDVHRNRDEKTTSGHPLTDDDVSFDERNDSLDRNAIGKVERDDAGGGDFSDLRALFEEGLDLSDTDDNLARSAVHHRVTKDSDVNDDYDEETEPDRDYDEEDPVSYTHLTLPTSDLV